jgi:flagellar protein FliS
MNRTDLAYRKNAAEATSGLGLLIALYDTLAGDLRRAAQAQTDGKIEHRCREIRHALLVIGYLEDWIARGAGGALAQELVAFYSSLRRKLIEAEAAGSPSLLEQQMDKVLDLRKHWQRFEFQTEPSRPEILMPVQKVPSGYPPPQLESRQCTWSA